MNEIMQELLENVRKIEGLISNQKFKVEDAQKVLNRFSNIYRSMEDLEKSRDNWKAKYFKLKKDIELEGGLKNEKKI